MLVKHVAQSAIGPPILVRECFCNRTNFYLVHTMRHFTNFMYIMRILSKILRSGTSCYSVHENYCGSIPQRTYTNPVVSTVYHRCGASEVFARTFCTTPCTVSTQCNIGESCLGVHPNYCGSIFQ
jgi:hypothetical protein